MLALYSLPQARGHETLIRVKALSVWKTFQVECLAMAEVLHIGSNSSMFSRLDNPGRVIDVSMKHSLV